MYFLNYVDRNAIAQARLNNLEDDLGMTGVQFNTCVSILFVGYVLMQVPSSEQSCLVEDWQEADIYRYAHHSYPPGYLHEYLDVHLGYCISLHSAGAELRRIGHMSILPRYY